MLARPPQRHLNSLLAALGLLAVLGLTLYLSFPALTGPFLFDDYPNLENLNELSGGVDLTALGKLAATYDGNLGRPLSMVSFALNDSAWPSDAWPFKYTNLLIHLLVGIMVFGLARALARPKFGDARANWAGLLTAAAWLLHPMQLSTSMLVVQRMTQLAALFSLAGLWAYAALASRAQTAMRALGAVAALGAGTVLATLCKETGALTPLLAVVINVTLLRPRLVELPTSPRRLMRWGAGLPVLLLIVAIAYRWDALTGYGIREFSMAERMLTQPRVLTDYLYRILIPHLNGTGIYHDDLVISRSLLDPPQTLACLLLIASLLATAITMHRRWPLAAFALLWFFAGHVTESTVFPLEMYFEHRNYLPMIGPLFALACIAIEASSGRHRWAGIAAAAWVGYAALLTHVQAPIWGNTAKLATTWMVEKPMSPRVAQEYANYLYRDGQSRAAGSALLDAYQRGIRGSDFPAHALQIACEQHDTQLASRARHLINNALATAEFNNGALASLRRLRQLTQEQTCEAILSTDEWLRLSNIILRNPKYAVPRAQAYLHIERSYLYRHRRDLDGTITELEAAWISEPSSKLARLISITFASAGLNDEAKVWATRAIANQSTGMRGWLLQDERTSLQLLDGLRQQAQERPSAAQIGTSQGPPLVR